MIIKKMILVVIGVIILAGLIFFYKYAIYEPKEDWDNITWVKYKNTTNWLLPHWQVDVPEGWKSGNTTCCSYLGFSFVGWTSELMRNSILSDISGGGYVVDLFDIKDRDHVIAKLSIYKLLEQASSKDIENLKNNNLYEEKTKKNLTVFLEKKENVINSKPKQYSITTFITEIYIDKTAKAYIFSGSSKFEITLYYKTNSDPAKVYDAFNHIVNSFEIIE